MIAAARPGGAVVVEDLDHSAVFAEPRCAALDEFVALYKEAARRRGGDPEIGPRLPTMLLGVGLADVQVHVVQPVFMTGDAKRIHQITLENIAEPVVAAGLASDAELGDLVARLSAFADDPGTMMSFPRIFQVFGRRSSRAGTSG